MPTRRRRKERSTQSSRDTRLQLRYVSPSELTPWLDNPRSITKVELCKLQRSIKDHGFVQPVIVNQRTKTLIAGHQRLKAACELGLEAIPVVQVDLPEAQAKALALALNRLGGTWDEDRLARVLTELQETADFDLALTGFDDKEIQQVLAALERQQLPSPYEETAPDAFDLQRQQAPTRVGPGETWRLGRHLLHCGDSLARERLPNLLGGKRADYVLTDPPYGIGFLGAAARGRRKGEIRNDAPEYFEEFIGRAVVAIREAVAPGATIHLFCGASGSRPVLATTMQALAQHFELQGLLVWDRVDPGMGGRWRRSFEVIVEASVGRPRVWNGGHETRDILRYPRAVPQADHHPTPKPVALLEQLMRMCCSSKGLVLDPFLGSGSTLIAAERTGRRCVGVEIEPRYCDLALARFEALGGERAKRVREGEEALP